MDMGIEFSAYLRYVAALIFVLGLIWGVGILLRRGMGHRLGLKRAGEASLKIAEILPIDARRKLVLIRHRDREHLLLLGHEHSLVVAEHQHNDVDIVSGTEALRILKKESIQ